MSILCAAPAPLKAQTLETGASQCVCSENALIPAIRFTDAERRERDGIDIRPDDRQNNRPKIIWFKPVDKRVPLVAIPADQAPEGFLDHPDQYNSTLFVACIKRWPITSLHPFGSLVEELGEIGNIEAETNALLKDSGFTEEMLAGGLSFA